jgi:hypothetical protein
MENFTLSSLRATPKLKWNTHFCISFPSSIFTQHTALGTIVPFIYPAGHTKPLINCTLCSTNRYTPNSFTEWSLVITCNWVVYSNSDLYPSARVCYFTSVCGGSWNITPLILHLQFGMSRITSFMYGSCPSVDPDCKGISWAPEPVWTLKKKRISALQGIEPQFPGREAHSVVTTLNGPSIYECLS